MIIHCMKKENWEKEKDDEFICYEELEGEGFLHNSRPEHLWRILPRFEDKEEDYVLLCIDEDKVINELKYEYSKSLEREFPHIYGPLNTSAVIDVLDYLRDENGKYRKNPEFEMIGDD